MIVFLKKKKWNRLETRILNVKSEHRWVKNVIRCTKIMSDLIHKLPYQTL